MLERTTSNINTSGLGIGWDASCSVCGKPFRSFSDKQVVCSHECRFIGYRNTSDTNACWEWNGPKNNQGYGVLFLNANRANGRRMVTSAHRYAYARDVGQIPDGLCVMHKCDNPCCTNPAHLMLGTWADNNADRSRKGRSGSKTYTAEDLAKYSLMFRGEGNANAKLNERTAAMIRFHHEGMSSRAVGDLYGVTKSAVKSIRNWRTWKHVVKPLEVVSPKSTDCARPTAECNSFGGM